MNFTNSNLKSDVTIYQRPSIDFILESCHAIKRNLREYDNEDVGTFSSRFLFLWRSNPDRINVVITCCEEDKK